MLAVAVVAADDDATGDTAAKTPGGTFHIESSAPGASRCSAAWVASMVTCAVQSSTKAIGCRLLVCTDE